MRLEKRDTLKNLTHEKEVIMIEWEQLFYEKKYNMRKNMIT